MLQRLGLKEILRELILNGKVVGKIDQKPDARAKEETHQNAFARRVEDWSSAIEARWSSLRERESDARTENKKESYVVGHDTRKIKSNFLSKLSVSP